MLVNVYESMGNKKRTHLLFLDIVPGLLSKLLYLS